MANESENIVKGESKIIFTEMTMLVIVGLFTQLETYDLIFSVFNDHFLLFILASVAANHKTATESDVLNKIAGVLKYAHEKIGAGVVER